MHYLLLLRGWIASNLIEDFSPGLKDFEMKDFHKAASNVAPHPHVSEYFLKSIFLSILGSRPLNTVSETLSRVDTFENILKTQFSC